MNAVGTTGIPVGLVLRRLLLWLLYESLVISSFLGAFCKIKGPRQCLTTKVCQNDKGVRKTPCFQGQSGAVVQTRCRSLVGKSSRIKQYSSSTRLPIASAGGDCQSRGINCVMGRWLLCNWVPWRVRTYHIRFCTGGPRAVWSLLKIGSGTPEGLQMSILVAKGTFRGSLLGYISSSYTSMKWCDS